MSKVFGIALIVGLIWVGLEIYTEGTERAFGGVFARVGLVAASPDGQPAPSPLDRIRARATDARDAQVDRIERQVD